MIELKRTAQERLLGRKVDAILTTTDSGGLAGRRVLITGGGGSVGSELARQVAGCQPGHLVLFDHAEYNLFRIEGHTDDTPIRTARYSSNWELSTARASAVVARFIEQRVDPRRLSAAGYGEFHPRASNDTADGRASNRRVDVVVVVGRGSSPADTGPEPAGD